MQCQFCKQMLEDVNALQLHQVASCPAIDQVNSSMSFENETVEVVFKWLIDRVIKVPAVFLIGSNMEDNIELKKGVGCFKSAKVTVTAGKYSGQLVIDNDIVPTNDFEITLLSEVIHLIIDKDLSREESDLSDVIERDGTVAIDQQDGAVHCQQSSRRDLDDNALSPLHQEMLEHQIKNDYDFGDTHVSNKHFGNLLSEESIKGDSTTVNPAKCDAPTLHQGEDLSPDFSRVSLLPRDSEADDSFYHSFASPPAFETIDPDSTPSTPINNPSLYVNIRDVLSDISSVKDDGEGITTEPSMHSYVSAELIKHELEDAMRDTAPGSSLTSGGSEEFNNILGEKDESHINSENNDHNISVDYAGNPMSRYDQPGVANEARHNKDENVDFSVDYAEDHADKNESHQPKKKGKKKLDNTEKEKMQKEMHRMAELLENYKEVKIDLETKCESYDHEIERLNKKCTELEQAAQAHVSDANSKKDGIINDLKVKADSYESEMNRLNQEVVHLTELLEEDKVVMLEGKSKCHSYEQEIQCLNEKCAELAQNKEVEFTKLMKGYQENESKVEAKCESYSIETKKLTKKCTDLEKLVVELQQSNHEFEQTKESPCNEDSNLASKKDNLIAELSEKVQYCESENEKAKKEILTAKEMLEDHKTEKLQLETKCGKFELELKRLGDKCQELEKQKETNALNKEGDKTKSYKTEIMRLDMELHRLSEALEKYKENKVQLEAKCVAYDNEVKHLHDKCSKLEHDNENQPVASESDMIKDRIIGDLKVKAESYESEMNRLHQEVKRLTELVEEYKNIKLVLESKCQSYENEIESLKGKYQNGEHEHRTNELVKAYQELEQKFNELQTSNQKLIEDYKGLEGAKDVYEEEVQAERERYEVMIKELMDEKTKLVHSNKHDNRYSDNHARMNINKLKSENKILKEKLNLIRNESELNDSTTKENISPRAYKPPLLPNTKSYEPENIKVYSYRPSSRTNRHEHTSSNDDYALPSRYNANKYSKSPENYDKTDFAPRITETLPTFSSSSHLDNIMKRYSSPTNIDFSADSIRGRSRTRPNSYHDPLSYHDHNGVDHTKLFSSSSRSRSLDHLDSSGTDDAIFYKTKSLTTIPFCPTSVKELSIGMKISVNRANGRLSRGTVKWIGTLPRHSGDYVGVELESEVGKHDGNLSGIQYFKCKSDRGIFVKFPKVIMAWK